MIRWEVLLIILGMGIVTYIPRWLPLYFLSRRRLPPWFVDWLELIPVAILCALIVPGLLTSGTPRHLDLVNPGALAALPTFLFALKTRSLGGTIVVGMMLYWGAEKLF